MAWRGVHAVHYFIVALFDLLINFFFDLNFFFCLMQSIVHPLIQLFIPFLLLSLTPCNSYSPLYFHAFIQSYILSIVPFYPLTLLHYTLHSFLLLSHTSFDPPFTPCTYRQQQTWVQTSRQTTSPPACPSSLFPSLISGFCGLGTQSVTCLLILCAHPYVHTEYSHLLSDAIRPISYHPLLDSSYEHKLITTI